MKAKALSQTTSFFGGKADPSIYKRVMGNDWGTVRSTFTSAGKLNIGENEFDAKFREKYQYLIQFELQEKAYASDFIHYLKKRRVKLALVSSAASWMVNQILENLNLVNCFNIILSANDVRKHKPDPEVYILAMKRLTLFPEEVDVIEDSDAGVIAARNAGCEVIGMRHEA